MHKILNFILFVVFFGAIGLFAYKNMKQPVVLSASVHDVPSKSAGDKGSANIDSIEKEQLHAIIREYILNNPDDIMKSLENMHKKRVQDSVQKASDYLEENLEAIETEDTPPMLGNINGDITIVVFYDYNCSFCKKAHEYAKEILASDPGVKLILRPISILGDNSLYAAKVALAIQKISNENFVAIHDDMMQMRSITAPVIMELLGKYGIDYAIIENEVNSYSIKQLVSKNFELAKGLGVKGAPSYVINGNFVSGLITLDQFRSIILQLRSQEKKQE